MSVEDATAPSSRRSLIEKAGSPACCFGRSKWAKARMARGNTPSDGCQTMGWAFCSWLAFFDAKQFELGRVWNSLDGAHMLVNRPTMNQHVPTRLVKTRRARAVACQAFGALVQVKDQTRRVTRKGRPFRVLVLVEHCLVKKTMALAKIPSVMASIFIVLCTKYLHLVTKTASTQTAPSTRSPRTSFPC